jgi:hypothetical protein
VWRPQRAREQPDNPQLELMSIRVEKALREELEASAESHGITRSRAASEYLTISREALRERDGIPVGRADELLEAFEGMHAVLQKA